MNLSNDSKGKLVQEINPDNFAYESEFTPKFKQEIKQENSEKPSLLVTNVQSLKKPNTSKHESDPRSESDTENRSNASEENEENLGKEPIKLGPQKYGCPFCSKIMQKPSEVKKHIRIHTGEKPFSCNECGKAFNVKQNLNQHILTHTGEKPFSCEFCEHKTNQKAHLEKHMRRKHSQK